MQVDIPLTSAGPAFSFSPFVYIFLEICCISVMFLCPQVCVKFPVLLRKIKCAVSLKRSNFSAAKMIQVLREKLQL